MNAKKGKTIKGGKISKAGKKPKPILPRPLSPPQGQGSEKTTEASDKKKS
jgi:hypothetical protein